MKYEEVLKEMNDLYSDDSVYSAQSKINFLIDTVVKLLRKVVSKELNKNCDSDLLIPLMDKAKDLHNPKLMEALIMIVGINSAKAGKPRKSLIYLEDILPEIKTFCEETEKYLK